MHPDDTPEIKEHATQEDTAAELSRLGYHVVVAARHDSIWVVCDMLDSQSRPSPPPAWVWRARFGGHVFGFTNETEAVLARLVV